MCGSPQNPQLRHGKSEHTIRSFSVLRSSSPLPCNSLYPWLLGLLSIFSAARSSGQFSLYRCMCIRKRAILVCRTTCALKRLSDHLRPHGVRPREWRIFPFDGIPLSLHDPCRLPAGLLCVPHSYGDRACSQAFAQCTIDAILILSVMLTAPEHWAQPHTLLGFPRCRIWCRAARKFCGSANAHMAHACLEAC